MDDNNKIKLAVDFINSLAGRDHATLTRLITGSASEELAQFFLNYSANLILNCENPREAVMTCGSLMLLGYLCRVNEEKLPQAGATQPKAFA